MRSQSHDYQGKDTVALAQCMETARADFGVPEGAPFEPSLYASFPQIWGNTAMMFIHSDTQMAGAAMRAAFTTILRVGDTYCVYCNGVFGYRIENPSDRFFEDVKLRVMATIKGSHVYKSQAAEKLLAS